MFILIGAVAMLYMAVIGVYYIMLFILTVLGFAFSHDGNERQET